MANRQGISAGKAFLELFLDDAPATTRLQRIGSILKRTGKELAKAAALASAPFALGIKTIIDVGADLREQAKKTGLSMDDIIKRAQKMGLSLSTIDAKSVVRFSEAFDKLKTASKNLFANIGAALARPLTIFIELLNRGIVALTEFIKHHHFLVTVAAVAAAALAGIAATTLAVAGAFTLARNAVFGFQVALALLSGVGGVGRLLLIIGAILALTYALQKLNRRAT